MTAGRDHGTYILALKNLTQELEYKAWFAQFPGGAGIPLEKFLLNPRVLIS